MDERHRLNSRIPWWMYVVGLSYVLTLGVILYLIFWGPAAPTGITGGFTGNAMVIAEVIDGSQAAKAGLRAGDRLVMIDDQPIRTLFEFGMTTGNLEVGRLQRWVVLRGAERLNLEITPVGVDLRSRVNEGYPQYLSLLLPGFFVGILIAWKRPADPVVRIGAWFILTASMAFGFPIGWAVPWRMFPAPFQALLWIPQLSRFVLEGIFLSFFLVFPRQLIARRGIWFAIWIPVLLTLPWRVKAFSAVIYPGPAEPVPAWILTAGFTRSVLYLLIGIVVLAVSYYRVLDTNEKRRVRVLMLGTAVSLIAAINFTWHGTFAARFTALRVLAVFGYFMGACPISLAYAILRHRILDVSVIIRQGLQYAFARGGVIGFAPLMGGLFVLDLTINSDQRIADIFRTRGWVYATAAALSLVAYWNRQKWLEAIDRRFFREQYNAQHLLREVAGEIRAAGDFERAAARVVERIETALHPEFVCVLVHPPGEPAYRAVATSPQGQLPPRLTAENKVVALLHVLGKPLVLLLGDSGWLDERLPQEESEFVRRARIDLLVPIASGPTQTEALLACGIKRSEEPYTREDQQLLEAIAASLALLLEAPAPAVVERPAGTFTECPECGTCYDAAVASCRHDNEKLVPMRVPRILASRYRLERRRGKGGMGAVYEATDNSLERRVAIKLIRDDLVDSVDARHRFRREARAAASFTHPNVVTIYDYGVDGDTRAFLVMELLQGRTLREELKQQKRLPASRIVEILRGVCSAVEAAHHRELIHRDLKPENIFIVDGAGGPVKVLDFGIAKFLPSHDDSAPTRMTAATDTGVLIGTPAYMSPEQLMGQPLNVLWDLWALSVVAYEALTGALPFAGGSIGDWSRGILTGNFTPLSEHLDNAPEQWQALFTQAFSGDRSHRPQSAAEFFQRLEQTFAV